MNKKTHITIDTHTRIEGFLPFKAGEHLEKRLTFPNPKWLENDKYGYWQGKTPKYLSHLIRSDEGLVVPRGFTSQLLKILEYHHLDYVIDDRTRRLKDVSFEFQGKGLR